MYKPRYCLDGSILGFDVQEILGLCIDNKILQGEKGIWCAVYHSASKTDPENFPEGWHKDDYVDTIQSLRHDEDGLMLLVNALKDRCGIEYTPSLHTEFMGPHPYEGITAKLLTKMCELTAEVPMGYDPKIYGYKDLAERLDVPVYQIRKAMKQLEADGLVTRNHEGGADYDGHPFCIHGWSITEQTRKSYMYKDIEHKAIDEFEKWEREFQKKWEEEHNA